jgi:hypothetical protein
MTELSVTISFQVAGNLDLGEVDKEISRLRDERGIAEAAKITKLTCRIEGDVTKCSVKWALEYPWIAFA